MKKPSNRAARRMLFEYAMRLVRHECELANETTEKRMNAVIDAFERDAEAMKAYLLRVLPDPPKPKKRRAKR